MSIHVKAERYVPALERASIELRSRYYLDPTGLRMREKRTYETHSDTCDYWEYRDSTDNGKTWGEWIRESAEAKEPLLGEDQCEFLDYSSASHLWNPVHRHYVSVRRFFVYLNGREEAWSNHWANELGFFFHSYLVVENEANESVSSKLVAYEDGALFDRETYRTSGYLAHNRGSCSYMTILKDGDILFNLEIPMHAACRLAGVDVNTYFPSCPDHATGILICRGTWNEAAKTYDLHVSAPIMMDDRLTSRGFSEAAIAELSSGRILVVLRCDSKPYPQWGSRCSPYAPGYKWYCLSDDGGRTFSPPTPWHYDTHEVLYSSATYSRFIRSSINGKLYWVGNITEPTTFSGNWPRYPLQILEVDDEWGCAKKETVTVIDTRRDGETERVQLSNFCLIEDRETGAFLVWLSKYAQFDGSKFTGEVWQYEITVTDEA